MDRPNESTRHQEIWLTEARYKNDSIYKRLSRNILTRGTFIISMLFIVMGLFSMMNNNSDGEFLVKLGLIILTVSGFSYWTGGMVKKQEKTQLVLIQRKIEELNQLVEQITHGNANPDHLAVKYLFTLKDVIQLSLGIKHFSFDRETLDLIREGIFAIASSQKIRDEIKEDMITMSVKYQLLDELEEKYMRHHKDQ